LIAGADFDDERDRDAERKRKQRAAGKDVVISPCADPERRARLEADDEAWLGYYFAPESGCLSPFTYDFTSQQREMVSDIRSAILNGDDQSDAASRGEGKTTICERLLTKYTLQGRLKFSVLFAATGGAAEDSLEAIKLELETNDRLLEDYPEVCIPIRALENTPNRAHYQTVSGHRHDSGNVFENVPSKFSWCGQEVYLPNVPGSPSAGAIIATRGLDSAVRGLKKKGRRVDLAVIDDPDTEDTARSEDQANKLVKRIDRAIAGLGSQQRRVARVMLTTLQSRISASYLYTDREAKPSWRGRRFRFLVTPPTRSDLWEEYVRLMQTDWQNVTTEAHEFYVTHREEMDAGAEVANCNRYVTGELSALQHYYNLVARIGAEAVATEYDNDPPDESGVVGSGISVRLIQTQLNEQPRLIIPDGCTLLTHNCDVGKLKGFHWVVRAWEPTGTGHVIDYGIMSVQGAKHGSDEGLERAIVAAILRRVDEFKSQRYAFANGDVLDNSITTFDARWQTDAVLTGVSKAGMGVYGILGIGRSAGCIKGTFRDVIQNTQARRKLPTTGAYEELHVGPYGKLWAIHASADKWKGFEHERWLTAQDRPGCMFLWGEKSEVPNRLSMDERFHEEYAKQICAEREVQDGQTRKWTEPKGDNDFFDASWHSCCAAAIKGIRVLGVTPKKKLSPAERPTPEQLAARSARA
jgi:hypothetical protein